MKIKVKSFDPFKVCNEPCSITFQEYSGRMERYTNKQLGKIFKQVFHRECDLDIVWARYLIHYELARQQYIKEGKLAYLDKNSQFRKAYMAVRRKDLANVNENLKTLIVYDLKHQVVQSQETIMKKQEAIKKAVEAKKSGRLGITLGLSVPETWVHVFITNAKEHNDDDKISKFMHNEFPDLKNKAFDTVHGCRIHYNNGGYTKGVKPEVKSVRYLADGSEWKRGNKAPVKVTPEEVKKAVVKKAVKKPVAIRKVKVAKK